MFEDRPPAKVNLTLEVVGRRPDGYHDLRSIFLRIGLADRLTMVPAASGTRDQLTVTGLPGAPLTRDNLVLRALDSLRAHAGIDFPPLEVTLDKHIPAAAGLGGGSSNAASALRLAQAAWGISFSAVEPALALELGSDVPFFLSDRAAAFVEGRGEHIVPLPDPTGVGLLLVTPPIALATARVFARHDDLGPVLGLPPLANVDTHRLVEAAGLLRGSNDLWLAAASLEPSLAVLRAGLETATGRPWMLSGSGPTLFALYASADEAAEAGRVLVDTRSPALDGALLNAVDLDGRDPVWRYP
ncbi:MAG: 4-(cytidine 5'-diphospho)-2-C-methyl-D-erythritol kinase [Candidatus Limnocylindrales bacterium]